MTKIIIAFFIMFLSFSSVASNVNTQTFLDHNWDNSVLSFMLDGPATLDVGEQFYISPFPANDSDETLSELKYLHELSKKGRDDITVEKIIDENKEIPSYGLFIQNGLIDRNDTSTISFLEYVDTDIRYFVVREKKRSSRARPSEIDLTLSTVIPNPGHPSYPSGHATQSYAIASILADFDPDNADAYYDFANDVAKRREIAGVHYPSDSEVGQKLAVQILKRLRENTSFEKNYQATKKNFIKP